jgi:hypothetical protein
MRKRRNVGLIIIAIIVAIFALTSCADVSHVQSCLPPTEHTYGFWGGTWHGMIMVPSFIGSLIWDDIAVYAVNNNGGWYNFGYVGGFFFMLKGISYVVRILRAKQRLS